MNKILIANRGEIACRVIKTAKLLGIETVAVYSDADVNALHTELADEAYYLGPSPSRESYLCSEKILEIAKESGAQAIHPGYGFLSENAEFAKRCEEMGIAFIGPPSDAIALMGSKQTAKQLMEKASVPLVPGYHGDEQSPEFLLREAEKIGFPVLLKAVAGGGGKGMRVVNQPLEFAAALVSAQREARASFGNSKMLLEKYLVEPRHIEIQVFADKQGNCVHLFERDCSIQRRHQKVLEEAPAPNFSHELREKMGETAIKAAETIGYVGAGTVEFLLDHQNKFYFMEMNTRLQVEHPVTEMITQLDLVEWQIRVARGESLPLKQNEIRLTGHAIEARVYAEDPDNDFLPCIGQLRYLREPKQSKYVRVDTGVRPLDTISPYYDPMIAKLIVWDETREAAVKRLQKALWDYQIVGLKTNLLFLSRILNLQAYQQAQLSTHFIEDNHDALHTPTNADHGIALALASLYVLLHRAQKIANEYAHTQDPYSPWGHCDGWRLNYSSKPQLIFFAGLQEIKVIVQYDNAGSYLLKIEDKLFTIKGRLIDNNELTAIVSGRKLNATVVQEGNELTLLGLQLHYRVSLQDDMLLATQDAKAENKLTAPMPGTVVAVMVEAGSLVAKGDALLVIEAMKMEHTIYAPDAGEVKSLYYQQGDSVKEGAELMEFIVKL